MRRAPTFSLIVPTRHRIAQLRRFLDSIIRTVSRPDIIEIVLVVDEDDRESGMVRHNRLCLNRVVVAPGLTMGSLNMEGYLASTGRYLMLLNDDVIARTGGWDRQLLACCRRFPDGIGLVHVNDTLLRHHLCTFPLVSRTYCEFAGGICPREYTRYRIDDHIEDIFNLLAFLGHRRTVYLPDVVFEHCNAVDHPEAGRVYQSDSAILAEDAPRFEAMFAARKELALRLVEYIEGRASPEARDARQRKLEYVSDPFSLRVAGRQEMVRAPCWRRATDLARWPEERARRAAALLDRAHNCLQQKGFAGLVRAIGRRFVRRLSGQASLVHGPGAG
jgi:hypothetical protein